LGVTIWATGHRERAKWTRETPGRSDGEGSSDGRARAGYAAALTAETAPERPVPSAP
jgi:hypothetical protein